MTMQDRITSIVTDCGVCTSFEECSDGEDIVGVAQWRVSIVVQLVDVNTGIDEELESAFATTVSYDFI